MRAGCTSSFIGTGRAPFGERWYVVHTHPHCETRVIGELERQDYTAFCPCTLKTVRHARRSATKLAPVFPNYVFVRFNVDEQPWRCINGTRGAVRLITNRETPAPVPFGVVERLQSMVGETGAMNWVPKLKPGDQVRIEDGPFAALIGTLERLDPSGRVRVLLDLLGREVSVTLSGEAISPVA
nr:transcription termination/antitermination NusG family protein [Rhizomicrobium electricum]